MQFGTILGVFSSLLVVVVSQSSQDALKGLPACAVRTKRFILVQRQVDWQSIVKVNCTLPVVLELPCNITTLPQLAVCLCPNITAQHALSACVQKSCDFADQKSRQYELRYRRLDWQLVVSSIGNQQLCANIPIESRQAYINVILIVVTSLTLPFILLRAWSRWVIAKHFSSDDWAIVVSAALILTSMGLELKSKSPFLRLLLGLSWYSEQWRRVGSDGTSGPWI